MVRLKENQAQVLVSLEKISIPYGAIKSPSGGKNYHRFWEFQFLMVRLKGPSGDKISRADTHFNSLWCD